MIITERHLTPALLLVISPGLPCLFKLEDNYFMTSDYLIICKV